MDNRPSFSEFAKVVTRHVLGGQEDFLAIKARFEAMEFATTKAGAAALGYLVAMDELSEKEQNKHDEEAIHEAIRTILLPLDNRASSYDVDEAIDKIMTAIYWWLDKQLEKEGFAEPNEGSGNSRYTVESIFSKLIIPKHFM